LALSGGKGTTDPLLSAFLLAKQINLAAGGTVVAPWEVGELPEEWIEAARGLTLTLPEMRAGKEQVEDHLAHWRKRHKEQNG
jgi:hypothetical protein